MIRALAMIHRTLLGLHLESESVLFLVFDLWLFHLHQRGVCGGIVVLVQFGNLGIDVFQVRVQQAFKHLRPFGHGPA